MIRPWLRYILPGGAVVAGVDALAWLVERFGADAAEAIGNLVLQEAPEQPQTEANPEMPTWAFPDASAGGLDLLSEIETWGNSEYDPNPQGDLQAGDVLAGILAWQGAADNYDPNLGLTGPDYTGGNFA